MIASLVVTSTEASVGAVRAALAVAEGVEAGAPIGVRVPVIAEASSSVELRALFDAIQGLPGVERVELVMFHFPSQHEEQPHEPS